MLKAIRYGVVSEMELKLVLVFRVFTQARTLKVNHGTVGSA